MMFFLYRQALNSWFSEEVAATQQDLMYLESRASCTTQKIMTCQQRNHLRHLEEA